MTPTILQSPTAGSRVVPAKTPDRPTLYTVVDSPIGDLMLVGREEALCGVYMTTPRTPQPAASWQTAWQPFACVADQLGQYFAGVRQAFDLELDPVGTPFQLRAWRTLREIPFGETWSYGEQARAMGHVGAARAVGAANRANPLAVVVPCHRVVGHDGALTGFGGGLPRKRYLLDHEAAVRAALAPAV